MICPSSHPIYATGCTTAYELAEVWIFPSSHIFHHCKAFRTARTRLLGTRSNEHFFRSFRYHYVSGRLGTRTAHHFFQNVLEVLKRRYTKKSNEKKTLRLGSIKQLTSQLISQKYFQNLSLIFYNNIGPGRCADKSIIFSRDVRFDLLIYK